MECIFIKLNGLHIWQFWLYILDDVALDCDGIELIGPVFIKWFSASYYFDIFSSKKSNRYIGETGAELLSFTVSLILR